VILLERVVTFKADVFLVRALDIVAKATRKPRSWLIREAIVNYLYASVSNLPAETRKQVLDLLEKANI